MKIFKIREVLVLAVGLGLVPIGMTQKNLASKASIHANAGPSPAGAGNDSGPHEGIKVHGHWTIVIHDPKGGVVSRHEFENSYFSNGAKSILNELLARKMTPGFWLIGLRGSTSNWCVTVKPPGNTSPFCAITEPNYAGYDKFADAKTLTTTLSAPIENKFVLSGTITAQVAGSIDSVQTWLTPCPATNAPSTPCDAQVADGYYLFTTANITPVNFQAGQQILVNVEISFS